jgi:hypothetical protein
MCFGGSKPAPTPPPPPPTPPPAALAPEVPKIGVNAEKDSSRGQQNRKKKGTSSLRIERSVGGTSSGTGTNIPTK